MELARVEARLREAFGEDASIKVEDLTGGGDHLRAVVTSRKFVNKSRVEQHQMVYQALGEWMHKEIHALALQTAPPDSTET